MAMPENILSPSPMPAAFIGGAALSITRTNDYEMGAGALNDPTLGHNFQLWHARIVDETILIGAENLPEFVFYEGEAVTDVSIAFDQNMRLHVAYRDLGNTYFYWFNTQTGVAETWNMGASVITPKITLDDKRSTQSGASDVIIAYIRAGKLYHRRQRDRFQEEYLLDDGPFLGLEKMGMNSIWRLQFLLSRADAEA